MAKGSNPFDQLVTIWSKKDGSTPFQDNQPSPDRDQFSGIDEFEVCLDNDCILGMHRQYDSIAEALDDALYCWYCFQQDQSDDHDVYFIALTQRFGALDHLDRLHIHYAFRAEEGGEDEDEFDQSASVGLLEENNRWTSAITEKLITDDDLGIESFEDIVVMRVRFNT